MSFKAWIARHPRLTAWAVLAVGMVVILVWAARNVGLLPGQWAALIIATILLAGLCVWIIGWDQDEEEEQPAAGTAPDSGRTPEPVVEVPPETADQEEAQSEG
jgi:MFS superfamily sulfate permease-like transporter